MTPEQHKKIKAAAVLQGKSIKEYVLNQILPTSSDYEVLLSKRFQDIAEGTIVPRIFLKRRPEILFTHCEHRYIFYLQSEGRTEPIILAMLHERMNLIKRLNTRLLAEVNITEKVIELKVNCAKFVSNYRTTIIV